MEEGLPMPMFTEFFGDLLKPPFGVALSALLTKEDLTLQALTSRLLNAYSPKNATNSARYVS